jgi:hypothetical protein
MSRFITRLLPLLALATLLTACDELLPPAYRYGTVEVEAVRRNGEPVPGVRLTLFTGTRHLGYGVTDERGRYRFEFVPEGQLGVQAAPPEDYRPVDLASGFVRTISMAQGGEQQVSFSYLRFGPGSVLARVETPTGQPVPGIRVQVYSNDGVQGEAVTNAQGEHRFTGLPLGVYGVFAFPTARYLHPEGRPLAVVEGLLIDEGHEERARILLTPCEGRVRVEARDTEGRPIAALRLRLYTAEGEAAQGQTDAQGVHVFEGLGCGDYAVLAEERVGLRLADGRTPWWFPGLIVQNGAQRDLTLTFAACSGRIEARVQTAAGAPVAGARLILYSPAGFVAEGRSDALGRHLFSAVGCGAGYGVAVEPPAGYGVAEGRGSSFFDGIAVTENSLRELVFTLRVEG